MDTDLGRLEKLYIRLIDRVSGGESLYETRSRAGIFSPALTMWLLVNGWAKGRRGLSTALEGIVSGEADEVIARNGKTKKGRITPVSANSGGLSRARQRLKLDNLKLLSGRINELLISEVVEKRLWHGRRVYLFDGTTIALTRAPEVFKKYQPVRNQNGETYSPSILCGVCHELFSGIALNPRHGAYRGSEKTSEVRLCCEMMGDLPSKSLLIADRAMGIFSVAYEANRRGHQVLVRLTAGRVKSVAGKAYSRHEYIDEPVSWRLQSTQLKDLNIPEGETIDGRFIKWTVKRKGHQPLELFFFTTSPESTEELVALYQQRERIENDIRTLKHTIGLERLYSKTPEMISQELLLGVLAYNLIRAITAQAAKELKLEPRQFSITRAAAWIRVYGNKMRDAGDEMERKRLREDFLRALSQSKLPNRKECRIEPRKIARPPQSYPLMRGSREEERKRAEKVLSENGHRGYYTSVTRNG